MSYEPHRGQRPPKSNTTLIIVLVVGGVFGLLICGGVGIALFLPAVQQAREAARRSTCKNNLKQISLALHNYHEVYGSYPPAYFADKNGKPMHSWRVMILPFLEAKPLYDRYRFDEPWDGPNNRQLARSMPALFACPSTNDGPAMTRYVTVRGPGTAFPGAKATRFRDFSDGSSVTIAVVETPGRPVHWMAPDDVSPEDFIRAIDGQTHHNGGTHILMADGAVRFLSSDTSAELIRRLLSIAGGEAVGDF
ncbi:MAG: DUF1559 domain-containing protein [Planctomycetaceae bacterium]